MVRHGGCQGGAVTLLLALLAVGGLAPVLPPHLLSKAVFFEQPEARFCKSMNQRPASSSTNGVALQRLDGLSAKSLPTSAKLASTPPPSIDRLAAGRQDKAARILILAC
jgi:hypothetical protein